MKTHILVLGAGFGGLELSTRLSESFGGNLDVTLIDKSDAFVLGYSKLDLMFGHTTLDAVRLPYRNFVKPGVNFRQETITAIDPNARRVTTNAQTYEADFLVIALGADYDMDATPGLAEAENEFYSVAGAARLRDLLPTFSKGHAIIGVCGAPFKCPPAPSECALMLHDYLVNHRPCNGVGDLDNPTPPDNLISLVAQVNRAHLVALADDRSAGDGAPWIFSHNRLQYKKVSSRWRDLCRGISCRAGPDNDGVTPFPFHHLRHRYAVDYLKTPRPDGTPASIYLLSQYLGHTSVKTTEVYLAYLSPEEKQAVMFGRSGYKNGYQEVLDDHKKVQITE